MWISRFMLSQNKKNCLSMIRIRISLWILICFRFISAMKIFFQEPTKNVNLFYNLCTVWVIGHINNICCLLYDIGLQTKKKRWIINSSIRERAHEYHSSHPRSSQMLLMCHRMVLQQQQQHWSRTEKYKRRRIKATSYFLLYFCIEWI